MFEKKSSRIPSESLQVQALSDRKRGNLAGKVGAEIFHGVKSPYYCNYYLFKKTRFQD